MNKVIAVIGPTCSGKTSLSIELAKKYNGEIISADSRQVYRGLDLGTGKVTKTEMQGIPHHLIDIADPKEQYSVAEFQKEGLRVIEEIQKRGKLPIVAGGTGQYVDALLYTKTIPEVPPNKELRNTLEQKTAEELFNILSKKDPERAESIERHNKRRLVRALEIIEALGSVPKPTPEKARFDHLILGLHVDPEVLREKIHERLLARLKDGMIDEARSLHQNGLPWERFEELGLEYRYLKRHLADDLNYDDMVTELEKEIGRYARRQRTWWRNRTDITWIEAADTATPYDLVERFLN